MTRVLLVDDQALVRSGIRIIIDSEPDLEVVGEAANGAEAVQLAASLAPDVICMDVEMPVMNGIEASRQILAQASPGHAPSILILTTFGHEAYLFDALAAGVSGFLLKTSRAEQLIDGVRLIAEGGSLLGPEVTGAVMSRVRNGAPSMPVQASGADPGRSADADTVSAARETAFTGAGLTARERAVLLQLAEGRTNAEIASALFLGEATVKTHVSNVLQKLGVRDRLQAVVWVHTRS